MINTSDIISDNYTINDTAVISDTLTNTLLICSVTNLSIIFIYWTYLLYSSLSLSPTWHSLFPHFILLGQFLGSSSSLLYVVIDQSSTSFSVSTLLVPISYTIIFSTLLVRLVYIHSYNKNMYKLPTLYQSLLLFFCILVQVSVSIQSLLITQITVFPSFTSMYFTDMIFLSYSSFMLLCIICISTILRRTEENKEEVRYIMMVSLVSLGMLVSWVVASLVMWQHYHTIKGMPVELITYVCVCCICFDFFALEYEILGNLVGIVGFHCV